MLRRQVLRIAVCCAVLAAVLGLIPKAIAQAPENRVEVIQKFNAAAKMFREGDYEKAAAALDALMKTPPTPHEALVMREQAGLAMLAKMLREPKMAAAAGLILREAAKEMATLQRDAETIKGLMAQLDDNDAVKVEAAVRQLAATGPFAVPYLLDAILGPDVTAMTNRKVQSFRALRMMGPNATLPLAVAAQNAPAEDAARIVPFLADAPDARAIPALAGLAESATSSETLRNVAAKALQVILPAAGEKNAAPAKAVSAAEAALNLGARYYYNDPAVVAITPENERVIWRWNAAGKTYAERLAYDEAALYAYPRVMAQGLLLDGMALTPERMAFYDLFICNSFAHLEAALAAGGNDAAALDWVVPVNASLGAPRLQAALGRAVRDGSTAVASRCIAALLADGDTRAPQGTNALAVALGYPDRVVRAQAAEAMMRLSPEGGFGSVRETVNAVAQLLGATQRSEATVLSADKRLCERVSRLIAASHASTTATADRAEAARMVKNATPPVALLVVDANLSRLDAAAFVAMIRKDVPAEKTSILVLAEKAQVQPLQQALAGGMATVLALPAMDEELAAAMANALAAPAAAATEDVLSDQALTARLLTAVKGLPSMTQYPIPSLAPALIRLTANQPEEVRVLALNCLGQTRQAQGVRPAYVVFTTTTNPAAVRMAAGEALANLLATTPELAGEQREAIRGIAAKDADAALRGLAVRVLAMTDVPAAERQMKLFEVTPDGGPK